MIKQFFLATIIAFTSGAWSSATAQRPISDASGASPKDKSFEDKFRSDEFERVRREADRLEERRTARFPQIKQDFERIQQISSELLQSSSSNAQLAYLRISEGAEDIRRRAARLKSNLFPSASKDRTKQGKPRREEPQDLKSLVIALDKSITRFVHNPIFENIKVVDPQDSTGAERELEEIIKLSASTIKKADLKRR